MSTPKISVSMTYSEWTPESAENGDESDSGFVFESKRLSFKELVDLMRDNSLSFSWTGSDWLSREPYVISYATGLMREESLHFDKSNPPHLWKWFALAEKVASCR